MERTFEIKEAVREAVPLLIGLVGPSGSGKTGSALELAHGIQDVVGGDIGYIDTESKRALHYAGAAMFSDKNRKFKFRHLSFGEPFNPDSYQAAIRAVIKAGVKTVIVDSMSHEHEGPGGVLEMHEAQLDKLAGQDFDKRNKNNFLAWAKPKAERRALINFLLQQPVNFIFCFRAKEKLKMNPGAQPVNLGWQPVAGEEYVFEMSLNALLMPGSNGVPTWLPTIQGEKQMVKLPEQFKAICSKDRALSAAMGRELAMWAKGGDGSVEKPKSVGEVIAGAHGLATMSAEEKAALPKPVPAAKAEETHGQRAVKLMAELNSASSTADLKARAAKMKTEPKEVVELTSATYHAKLAELAEVGL